MDDINELFAVPILRVKLGLDVKEITNYCNKLHETGENRVVSNQGGFQTQMDMSNKALEPLIKKIELHARLIAQKFINENPQKVLGMWLNINGHNHCNLAHSHNGCDISGVYYVKTPQDCGQLSFEHPACDVMSYYSQDQNITKMNTYNAQYWNFDPEEDWLYLFPGWLKHAVLANESHHNRISIAFNVKQS